MLQLLGSQPACDPVVAKVQLLWKESFDEMSNYKSSVSQPSPNIQKIDDTFRFEQLVRVGKVVSLLCLQYRISRWDRFAMSAGSSANLHSAHVGTNAAGNKQQSE